MHRRRIYQAALGKRVISFRSSQSRSLSACPRDSTYLGIQIPIREGESVDQADHLGQQVLGEGANLLAQSLDGSG